MRTELLKMVARFLINKVFKAGRIIEQRLGIWVFAVQNTHGVADSKRRWLSSSS